MRNLLGLLLLLCLGLPVAAAPTGKWIAHYEEVVGTIEFTASGFEFSVREGDLFGGFAGPIAGSTEPGPGRPGRLIVGPLTDSRATYEVVWYFVPEGSRTRFYFADDGFSTLEAAQAAQAHFSLEQADPFMSEEFYQRVSALPGMPELEQKEFVVLLEDILQAKSEVSHGDIDLVIDDLLIGRGYDPRKSQTTFNQAVDAYGDEPLIKTYLIELSK